MTPSFSRDTGLLCADAQLLLWGIKLDYAGFALERLELGSSLIPQTKLLATAPVYPCCSLPFFVVPKRGHSSPSTPAVSYGPASTSSSTLSTLLISSTDWRGSLMQVFQWNLYDPDVNPVASPSGLDMSGNEHYWADKISEHFFHRKPTDFHLRVWHASSLRLLQRHTLDCLWQDMNRRAPADMKGQAGMAVRKEKTLYSLLSTLKMCSGKDYNVRIVILVA